MSNDQKNSFSVRKLPLRPQIWGLFIGVFLICGVPARADWPSFRGPWSDGHASAPGDTKPVGYPLKWSETENVKWRTEIPYRGWSTPVVMGGQVWLTTATEDGHDFFAICVDEANGKILFNEKLFHSDNPEPLGNNVNCYATPSPVIEPGRVYVHFGSYGTACLDTSNAKVIWQRDDIPCRHFRGPSSSPVLFENLLILTLDGIDLQYTIALDKDTGKTVWKTDRSAEWNDQGRGSAPGDMRKSHATPRVVMVDGKPQLISPGAKAAYGYDPRTGREIWKVHHKDYSTAPVPLFDQGVAYIVTGRSKTELWAVKADGQGDVTDTKVLWSLGAHIGKSASPVMVDGLIYTVSDESFLSCVDAATGQAVWTERIGGGYQASPVYADGRLYFFSLQGATTVVKPGRTFEPVQTNQLADGFMASPAASDGDFFLRTKTHLYRIGSYPEGSDRAVLPQ
jgi:outer membrane protein assembly factor BamB